MKLEVCKKTGVISMQDENPEDMEVIRYMDEMRRKGRRLWEYQPTQVQYFTVNPITVTTSVDCYA